MSYEKGKSGNPVGRPIGSKSISAESIRSTLTRFIIDNLPRLQADFDAMKPSERLAWLEKVFRYAIPSLSSVDMIQYVRKEVEALPDDQLNQLAEKLLQTAN
ncbi:MAG: hypothetical protein WCR01_11045 [Bacteroidota bacterium]